MDWGDFGETKTGMFTFIFAASYCMGVCFGLMGVSAAKHKLANSEKPAFRKLSKGLQYITSTVYSAIFASVLYLQANEQFGEMDFEIKKELMLASSIPLAGIYLGTLAGQVAYDFPYRTIWRAHLKPRVDNLLYGFLLNRNNPPIPMEFPPEGYSDIATKRKGVLIHGLGIVVKSVEELIMEQYGLIEKRPLDLMIMRYQVSKQNRNWHWDLLRALEPNRLRAPESNTNNIYSTLENKLAAVEA